MQPFVPAVLSGGELSLVFFTGVFSHAVRKRADDRAALVIEHELVDCELFLGTHAAAAGAFADALCRYDPTRAR